MWTYMIELQLPAKQGLISLIFMVLLICFAMAEHISSVILFFFGLFFCFLGDDFSIIQQEIFMVKECTHQNIVAYFGSYLRYGQKKRLFVWVE